MENRKVMNLLNDADSESSRFAIKNGMLLMTKIMENMVKEMKMIRALNSKQKLLNQAFLITQMHIFL